MHARQMLCHPTTMQSLFIFCSEAGSLAKLPRLTLILQSSYFSLLSSWGYRHAPPHYPSLTFEVQCCDFPSALTLHSRRLPFHTSFPVKPCSSCPTRHPAADCLREHAQSYWRVPLPVGPSAAYVSPVCFPQFQTTVSQDDKISSYFSEKTETVRRELPHSLASNPAIYLHLYHLLLASASSG